MFRSVGNLRRVVESQSQISLCKIARNGSLCRTYEPCRSDSRPIPRQVHRSLLTITKRVSFARRSPATERDLCTVRTAQDNGVPATLHARKVRDDRQGRTEPLSITRSAVEAAAISFGIRGTRNGLSVFSRSLRKLTARRGSGRNRTHLAG